MTGNQQSLAEAFPETRWTVVRKAAREDGTDARQAFGEICRHYWFPLYAYLRRSGYSQQDAEDHTQEFFALILSRDLISRADAAQGKLRSFFLGVLKKQLSDARKRRTSQKRGGAASPIPMEIAEAELRIAGSSSGDRSPDEAYDFHWALTTLEAAMERLRAEYRAKGREALFDAVAPSLQGEGGLEYRQSAERLGMTESAVKVAAHRLRQRFRETLRRQVEDTLEMGADVDEELRHLRRVLHR